MLNTSLSMESRQHTRFAQEIVAEEGKKGLRFPVVSSSADTLMDSHPPALISPS
jgi:hypothetical protein